MTWTSCIVCGTPSPASRCTVHVVVKPSATARGYDSKWQALSKQARKLQPWCSRCGADRDLTADHLVWPAITIADVEVLCRRCNSSKGAAR